jgi:hypothetical protein
MNLKYSNLVACTVLALIGFSAYAEHLNSDGILVDDDGHYIYKSQIEALNACPAGTHLPTARELAEYSHSLGAVGIAKPSDFRPGGPHGGWYLVLATDPDGTKDEFYFNVFGYSAPAKIDNHSFWSSSTVTDGPGPRWQLSGGFGYLEYGYGTSSYTNVLCRPSI